MNPFEGRWKCTICNGYSWEDHAFCDAVIAAHDRWIAQQKEENSWLGFFEYCFDKWAENHPTYNNPLDI